MVKDKTAHFVLGTGIFLVSLFGISKGWLGPVGKPVFLILAILGGLWALIIGHAAFVIPMLVIGPFVWAFEKLDPRESAIIRRKADKLDYSSITVRDLKYFGNKLGHTFSWWGDTEGDVVVQDDGPNDPTSESHTAVFGVGRTRALITDTSRNREQWERLKTRPWLSEGGV